MMSNRVKVVLCSLLWVGLSFSPAWAVDRSAFTGVAVGIPLNLEPTREMGDLTYGLDFGYFLSDDWTFVMGWGFGLEGQRKIDLTLGLQAFLDLQAFVQPYVAAKFLYLFEPEREWGLRCSLGAEWNLRFLTGLDNLRLITETGFSQILSRTTGDELTLELFRLGLSWSY